MRGLVVLRPEPGASETMRLAQERGLDARCLPLFEIEALAWEAPEPGAFDGLLLTSANAVRHAGEGLSGLRGLPVYAVGEATAAAAREAGFDIKATGDSGVARLLGSLEPELKLLHLCGEDRTPANDARQDISAVAVYRATPVENADLADATDKVVAVHSARAARRLSELADRRATIAVAAISPAVAEQLGDGWQAVEVAERPRDDALLDVAERLCNKPPPQ